MNQGSTVRTDKEAAGPTTSGMATSSGVDRRASIRWIALFTGQKATEDYQPSATDGENPALVREVTNVCVALHPHSEIRLFPQSGEAFLYYRAKSTSELIVTRVSTAPNPDGVRTALEYCSLVLSDSDLQALLGGNPFAAARGTDLFDRVRAQFMSGSRTAIPAGPPAAKAVPTKGGAVAPGGPSLGSATEEPLATPENVAALEVYCTSAAAAGVKIPTFATWWSSGGAVPPGLFDLVLRAPVARALTLREASELLSKLAADVKTELPNTPEGDAIAGDLARSILASVDAAEESVTHAASHINTETPAQFQSQLAEASRQSSQVIADIRALTARLGTGLSATDTARLTALSARADELRRELPRVRHPNPFARRTPAPETTVADSGIAATLGGDARLDAGSLTQKMPTSSNAKIGVGAVFLAILGFGIWGAMGHGGSKPTKPTPSAGTVSTPAPPIPVPTAVHHTPSPGLTALLQGQESVEPVAKANAQKAGSAAITPTKKDLDEREIDAIAATAMGAAYKSVLSPTQYRAAFGGKTWNFARYKEAVPDLAAAVHEATSVGVADGQAALKIAEVKASATPKPEPTHDTSESHPRNTHSNETPREPTPRPRKHPDNPPTHKSGDSGNSPTPKAGSAASTGL